MIISILGMSGMDKEKKNRTTAYYDCDNLRKKSGDYHNATDMLIKNYHDNFYFIGTQKAIDFQKSILDFSGQQVEFIEINDNSLDDIFEKVYTLISQAKDTEKIILDITHGFRHQPISAIFSATLHKFLNDSQLEIIFAKQIVEYKEYEYIYLTEYIDMTQLALMLTGFIRTLNFVNTVNVENLNTMAFEKFSKALLSNDFNAIESSYKNLSATLRTAKKDKKFDHLKDLFQEVENKLTVFENFSQKQMHEKYLTLAQLMFDNNYYLLSVTYLFEALRLYATYSFYTHKIINNYAWQKFDIYKLNKDVISTITQKEFGERYEKNFYDTKFPNLYKKNHQLFEQIATEYRKLKKIRNDLTHINFKKQQPNIKGTLHMLLKNIDALIKDDILKDMQK